MKKTALLGGLLIMTLLTLFGCRRTSVIGHLTSFSFSYSTGNMMDASVCYTLKAEDGTVTITIKPDRVPDEQAVTVTADEAAVRELERILNEHEVAHWNGFNKNNRNVLDGNSFTLSVTMENGKDIHAHGYMKWPKGYQETKAALDGFFARYLNH